MSESGTNLRTKAHHKNVISYYDNTRFDYRVLWLNDKDRAIHFGYYETFKETHSEALEKLNAVMALKSGIERPHKVLDAGCGQGGSSLWLAKNIGCQTVGITLVPHQVSKAKELAQERNLDHLSSFLESDYCKTPFGESTFDRVWACESLCHAENKAAFYQEAFRVLKPGGQLIIAEYIRSSRSLSIEDEAKLNHWCKGWSMPDLDTWSEHEKNMKLSGFDLIDKKDVTENVSPSLHKLFKLSKKLLPLGKVLNAIKLRNDVMHGNQTASVSQYEALTKKLWYYCIYSAVKPINT